MRAIFPTGLTPGPTYDRSSLRTGIVHFGLGNFHRAHQAMYLDRLLEAGQAKDWAICGVGVMPGDVRMRDVLTEQDHLYTLVLKHTDGFIERRVIGSIVEYLYAPDDPAAVIEKLSVATTRIVSLTITEGGYNVNQATGEFDLSNPDVAHDLSKPERPRTVFGLIAEGLRHRREAGIPPFTIMSCDNIQSNGDVARRSFTAYARALNDEFGAWVESTVLFPNSMVDRITPATTDADRAFVRERLEVDDEWPVVAEPFSQWVLEDRFTCGRPPLEAAGAQLVDDVEPYELMKLRLLNASHQALAYFGILLGYTYVHEAATDPLVRTFVRAYMNDEATPTLQPVPGVNIQAYKTTLLDRFANREIRDTLSRLATDASDRIPTFLLPVVHENLDADRSVALSAAVVASWAWYLRERVDSGRELDIADALAPELVKLARMLDDRPLAFIQFERVFGQLGQEYAFSSAYLDALASLSREDKRVALRRIVSTS